MKHSHIKIYLYIFVTSIFLFTGQLFGQNKTLGELFYYESSIKNPVFLDTLVCFSEKIYRDSSRILYKDSVNLAYVTSLSILDKSSKSGFYVVNKADSVLCFIVFMDLDDGSTNKLGDLKTSAIYLFYYKSCTLEYIIVALNNSIENIFKVKDKDDVNYIGRITNKSLILTKKDVSELTLDDLEVLNLRMTECQINNWKKSRNIINLGLDFSPQMPLE